MNHIFLFYMSSLISLIVSTVIFSQQCDTVTVYSHWADVGTRQRPEPVQWGRGRVGLGSGVMLKFPHSFI